jgi:hypothetical protein
MPRPIVQHDGSPRLARCRGIKPLAQRPACPNITAAVLAAAREPTYTEVMSAEAKRLPRFLTTSLATELGILLTLSVLFPFMIHVLPVPEDARLGPRLLPMFYAPLLAALLGRKGMARLVALAAPWLNWAITSHPSPPTAIVMMLQLIAFVLAIQLLMRRLGSRWYLALPAYLTSVAAATLLVTAAPALVSHRPILAWAAQSIVIGLPGVVVLLLINWLVVRNYPSSSGGGPMAA